MRENDAISRSAVLKEIDWAIDLAMDDEMHHAMCTLGERFKELPALDVEPVVHARWIYSGEVDENGNCESNCSHCDAGDAHRPDLKDAVPYCWQCGARMDGETE